MKSVFALFLAIVLAISGGIVLSGCSSDTAEPTADESTDMPDDYAGADDTGEEAEAE